MPKKAAWGDSNAPKESVPKKTSIGDGRRKRGSFAVKGKKPYRGQGKQPMADRTTYSQLLEHSKQLNYLLELPELEEDEKEELEYIWNSLKSRKESKFDAIVHVI